MKINLNNINLKNRYYILIPLLIFLVFYVAYVIPRHHHLAISETKEFKFRDKINSAVHFNKNEIEYSNQIKDLIDLNENYEKALPGNINKDTINRHIKKSLHDNRLNFSRIDWKPSIIHSTYSTHALEIEFNGSYENTYHMLYDVFYYPNLAVSIDSIYIERLSATNALSINVNATYYSYNRASNIP